MKKYCEKFYFGSNKMKNMKKWAKDRLPLKFRWYLSQNETGNIVVLMIMIFNDQFKRFEWFSSPHPHNFLLYYYIISFYNWRSRTSREMFWAHARNREKLCGEVCDIIFVCAKNHFLLIEYSSELVNWNYGKCKFSLGIRIFNFLPCNHHIDFKSN